MSYFPRLIVSIIVVALIFIGITKKLNIPPDQFMPPPLMYKNATETASGTITLLKEEGVGDHLFQGDQTFDYVTYTFRPFRHIRDASGNLQTVAYPKDQTGTVHVDHDLFGRMAVGQPVQTIIFDPDNPVINGSPHAIGIWNRDAGWINTYLYWWLGMGVAVYILTEIIRSVTKSNE